MVGKLLVKNTLKLVLLLGVEMHLDLNNHNEDKLNVPKITPISIASSWKYLELKMVMQIGNGL